MAKNRTPIDTRVRYGDIFGLLKNVAFNTIGIARDFEQLLKDNDVQKAILMMDNRTDDVDEKRMQYDPEQHYEVLMRPDRKRKGLDPYTAEKLPRNLQAYINYVELFFLLNYPVKFRNDTKVSDSEFKMNDEAYTELKNVLKDIRFDTLLEEVKLLAGSETEAAMVLGWTKDFEDSEPYIKARVISASKGYKIRPLFDNEGTLQAFAYGWTEKLNNVKETEVWHIETKDKIYECRKGNRIKGWDVLELPNTSGKINAVYVRQDEAWKGTQRRIERREMLDSKAADTGNYVYAPLLVGKADAVLNLPDIEQAGVNAVQLKGEDAQLNYLAVPNAYEQYKAELEELDRSIQIDSLTPPVDPATLAGFGELSGVAFKRAMLIGYIKRSRNMRIYEEFVGRVLSVIRAIIGKVTNIQYEEQLDKMDISFSFSDPFPEDVNVERAAISALYKDGVISLRTAVENIGMYSNLDEEIEMIKEERGIFITPTETQQNT